MNREGGTDIQELVLKVQKGNKEAFSELMKVFMNNVYSLTYKLTGEKDIAKDMTQDTFVTAWDKIKSYRGEGNFAGWLYKIAANNCFNFLKRDKRKVSLEMINVESMEIHKDRVLQPDKIFENKIRRDFVLAFMQSLPEQQRLAFELRFYKEMSFNEIARILGSALGTVKTNYREAIQKLRQLALEKGWQK